jgi:hypothetical protein
MATRLLYKVTKENQRFLLVYKVMNDYSQRNKIVVLIILFCKNFCTVIICCQKTLISFNKVSLNIYRIKRLN